jgi:UDP-N-acetylglucosamine--N-acetylmuramyl-(pentapeptide) pyrophosphoryl-undecaprenol N-acetylglucosamine transferase
LRREKPGAVVGVGGYVSVPTVVAAWCLRIPVFLQEQNVSVGIANRFLGRLSNRIFLGFDEAKIYFNSKKCVLTGNPIRREFSSPEFPKHDPSANVLAVMGGSQGARAINEAMVALLDDLQSRFPGVSVIHQTGQKDYEMVRDAYQARFKGKYAVSPFITDMVDFYGRGSLVVARSGALTVSELIQVGRPAIFVPYPRKGQNDQTSNAYLLESHGVAKVVEQGPEFLERFRSALFETFRIEMLKGMSAGYGGLRTTGALTKIGDEIERALVS